MGKISIIGWAFSLAMLAACASAPARCQTRFVAPPGREAVAGPGAAGALQDEHELIIENASDLPEAFPRVDYEIQFHARGGVPSFHWRVEKGALPPGMRLEDSGLLHGQPERSGEFQFTVAVADSGKPQQAVQKGFVLRVRSALSLNWMAPAQVNGNRIEGSVAVSNATPDDMDLTFVVMAVARNGRATAIGYQHFLLRRGTNAMVLPFGDTLPNGGYVVHVDAVGEVLARNIIYRERMQTPGELHVTVGP